MNKVLLLVRNKGNRQLLMDWLARTYDVVAADAIPRQSEHSLCIVDAVALDTCANQIVRHKQQMAPVFTPTLLLVQRDDVSLATRHLWQSVDELVTTPISHVELQARMQLLLQTRRLSLQLTGALEAANAANRSKSAFLATMSHELRTPLNSIIGFTDVLLEQLCGPLNAEQAEQLAIVRASAGHLLDLINDVLDLSRIEAGRIDLRCELFHLPQSVERVIAIVRPQAESKNLRLAASVANGIGEIYSDRRRVEQILLNLLGNAVKFTESGSITLTVERVAGARGSVADEPRPAVRFEVTDTGIGISAEDLATLFQPFHQVSTQPDRQQDGTGLGLAICRHLARLLDGEVSAVSEVGKGSTFRFTLPLSPDGPSLP